MTREARHYIGPDAPAHLFLGQIEQESGCDRGATAFDGGMGLGQFMPQTASFLHAHEGALKEISKEPAPYDPGWSVRALVLLDGRLYGTVLCKDWRYALRAYNGGAGILNREILRAGTCEHAVVEGQCRRRIVRLKSGAALDLCKVNIDYPRRIFEKGEKYR